MKTKKLGNTDFEITSVGFGAWAIGGGGWEFGWGKQDDENSVKAIHKAIESCINWIDTAAVYGLGHSEEIVAKALKGMQEKPYVFTKCELRWDEKGKIYNSIMNVKSIFGKGFLELFENFFAIGAIFGATKLSFLELFENF